MENIGDNTMTLSKKTLEDYQVLLHGCKTRIKSDIKEFCDVDSLRYELVDQLITVKRMQTYFNKLEEGQTNEQLTRE